MEAAAAYLGARRQLTQSEDGDLQRVDMVISQDPQGQLSVDLDILWLLLAAYLVFFMQCGFALLEAGSVRAKNTKNILLKNLVDACVGALVWFAWGHSFAHGEGGVGSNGFIGGTNFFMSNSEDVSPDDDDIASGFSNANRFFAFWLFQWAFAATSATIVSGAVAERCQFRAYISYTFFITGFVYPVVAHWVWSTEGWLSALRTDSTGMTNILFDKSMGLIDFAGSGVVHMTGGGAALMGAIVIGPRYGRFDKDGNVIQLRGQSAALATLGVFILWFGWYGFNPGSTQAFYQHMYVASKTAVTTTLSAAASGMTTLIIHVVRGNPPDITPTLNGILAGLVSITASCSSVEPYGAAIIGCIGGTVYYSASLTLRRLQVDDPIDASPVHFFCGVWGLIAPGLFATPVNLLNTYQRKTDVGIFYGGDGIQLGVQVLGVLSIGLWTITLNFLMFSVLNWMGCLRVPQDQEITGLDISRHGGAAFTYEDNANGSNTVVRALPMKD